MIVCECCLEAIECHEGHQRKMEACDVDCEVVYGYYTEDGEFIKEEDMDADDDNYVEEYVWCEWCEEYQLLSESYEI